MARRPGPSLTLNSVVEAAVTVVERDGPDGLGVRPVAQALGIQSSSVYHHVDGLEGLRFATAIEGWRRLVASFPDPDGVDPGSTVRATALAYRGFVRANPGLYRLMVTVPFRPDDPALLAVTQRMVGLVTALGLPAAAAVHAIRGLRAAIHGFVDLEAAGQFQLAIPADASFDWLLDVFVAGLAAAQREFQR